MHVAARKRRLAMYRYWQKLPKKTFAAVGKEFGMSRQRASEMVKKAMTENEL
jgi:DNA-directed RNA polymerase sigma subunit (sigma70/sigma32)